LCAALIAALFLPAIAQAQGILLLAHGGREDWNREVLELASKVDAKRPVEVAFGMANKRAIQDAVNRLAEREVTGIVAVPLFISSHSSVIRATEYLLGKRDDAPPQMEAFARMSSRRAEADGGTDPDFDWTTPIETPLPVELTGALDGHDTVAEILITRALEVSETPADEVVVVVAHGPSSEEDNDLWLGNMSLLVKRMRAAASFSRIDHLTVRDDAPDDVQAKATLELRSVVERGAEEGKSVLIVPLLLSYGGIEKGIRERMEGLDYRMAAQGLLPDDRLAGWVLAQASGR
jgi:sirohydrochlorin ferrochelatase